MILTRWLASMAVLAALPSIAAQGCLGSGNQGAHVAEVRGDVRIDGVAVSTGAELALGQELAVHEGRAILRIAGAGDVRVFAQSRVRLGDSSRDVRLVLGKLWALVQGLGGDGEFRVETVNAVAGVRGTEFVVESDGASSDVRVMSGEVEVENTKTQGRKVRVRARQRTQVKERSAPTEPATYEPDGDHASWAELKRAFKEIGKAAQKGAKAVKETGREVGKEVKKGAKEVRDALKDALK